MTKKNWMWAIGAACVFATLAGCAAQGFTPIAVTKDPATVASCQKLDDVSAPSNVSDEEASKALLEKANTKGANYLLVASDDARVGVAYRCSMPATNATR
jgi:hypothetical protein